MGASSPTGRGWTGRRLNRNQRKKFETLIAVGAGKEPDFFDARRREAKALAELRELGARETRLKLRRPEERQFFAVMARELVAGRLWADDVALIAILLSQWASGKPFSPQARFDGQGWDATLLVDATFGLLGPVDGEGILLSWRGRLTWLADNGWLRIEGKQKNLRIALGAKLRTAMALEQPS